jgi:hypothetical protein
MWDSAQSFPGSSDYVHLHLLWLFFVEMNIRLLASNFRRAMYTFVSGGASAR